MSDTLTQPSVKLIHLPAERLGECAAGAAEFFEEGKLPGRFDPEVFVETWRALLMTGRACLLAIEREGVLDGGLGGILYPDPNDGVTVATEMFWYVRQGHRGQGLRLLRAFEQWSRGQGARRIIMVHLLTLQPEELRRLYRRLGYHDAEVHYLKELD